MLPYYKMTKTGKIFNKAKRKFYFVLPNTQYLLNQNRQLIDGGTFSVIIFS